jgi:hypothetical protein
VASVTWSFGDGPAITNLGAGPAHLWTSAGDYPVTFTAYNLDNPSGVSASTNAHVVPVNQPQLQSTLISNNAFGFQFVGQAGAYYTVQYSTNLLPPITWNTLQYLYPYPSTGGVYQVLDPLLNNQARYYRLRAQ